jgi:hypothetical protein
LVPQDVPEGEVVKVVTVPEPAPPVATVRLYRCRLNVAVTDVGAVICTMHGLVFEHPPPEKPANDEKKDGVAVIETGVSSTYV